MKSKHHFLVGAIFAFIAVALGAFAAHGMKMDLYRSKIWETAVRYQFYHALALLIVGFISSRFTVYASWFFSAGIVLFSGSLYLLVLTGERYWGTITPIGGLGFLIGWVMLIIHFVRIK